MVQNVFIALTVSNNNYSCGVLIDITQVSELRIQLTEEKDENDKLREELKKKDAEVQGRGQIWSPDHCR